MADRPLIIGRGPGAGLVVPSTSVAPRQCVMYVHEGQWVVHEWASGTLLNEQPLDGPTLLSIGDVLSFGNHAATLEIDPGSAAIGKRGFPAMDSGVATPNLSPGSPLIRGTPHAVSPYQPAAAAAPATENVVAPGVESEDTINWGGQPDDASTSSTVSYSRRRTRKQSSAAPIVIGVVLGVGITGGAVWLIADKPQEPPPVIVQTPTVVVQRAPKAPKPVSLFEENPDTDSPPAKTSTDKPAPGGSDQATGSDTAATPPPAPSTNDKSGAPDANGGDAK